MKTIQIFDPALCCSTGVCGVDVDQPLVTFSADVAWAKLNGAQIERFNLAQQPVAFAENPAVKGFLERRARKRCRWFSLMAKSLWQAVTQTVLSSPVGREFWRQ